MKNIIKVHLSAQDQAAFDDLLNKMETLLNGKFVALDENERQQYGSINEKNKLFVNKVRDYHANSPAMSSPDVDWDEFEADYQSRVFMESTLRTA